MAATSTIVLATASGRAGAQLDTLHKWRFQFTPYLWLIEQDGRVGIGPVSSSVYLSPSDIFDILKFGAMANIEARYGPWNLSVDGIYASVGDGQVFAVRGDTASLALAYSQTTIQPMAGYTFGYDGWGFDLLGGFRYWKLSASFDAQGPRGGTVGRANARTWMDATTGIRARWMPVPRVRFQAYADAGAGGSKGTWQLYSSIGYDIWPRFTAGLAYRALMVDYDHDNFLYDTTLQGFIFGLTYRYP